MRIFVNKENRLFFLTVMSVMAVFVLLQTAVLSQKTDLIQETGLSVYQKIFLLLLSFVTLCLIAAACIRYFNRQDKLLEIAVSQIDKFLSGDTDACIDCDQEETKKNPELQEFLW